MPGLSNDIAFTIGSAGNGNTSGDCFLRPKLSLYRMFSGVYRSGRREAGCFDAHRRQGTVCPGSEDASG